MGGRKLIRFGKSAFCVTLPQTWIKRNKLNKGDVLSVDETMHNSLEITLEQVEVEAFSKIELDITHKSIKELIDLILMAYLNGYSVIELQGPNSGKVSQVRENVQKFIAAEIMEVTSSNIIVHVFWNSENIEIVPIINRIGHITKSMLVDIVTMLKEGSPLDSLAEKSTEVTRQSLLARRSLNYALNHSPTAQKFNLSPLQAVHLSYVVYYLGEIAEYVEKIGRALSSISIAEQTRGNVLLLCEQARALYCDVFNQLKHQDKSINSKESEDFAIKIQQFADDQQELWTAVFTEYLGQYVLKVNEAQFMIRSMKYAPK